MPINYLMLGMRIKSQRTKSNMSQETLSGIIDVSRENINRFENGNRTPSLETLIDIANALGVSSDDLLIDSLEHHVSTADSELHRLLLDCNEIEEKILTRNAGELKKILYGLGI